MRGEVKGRKEIPRGQWTRKISDGIEERKKEGTRLDEMSERGR